MSNLERDPLLRDGVDGEYDAALLELAGLVKAGLVLAVDAARVIAAARWLEGWARVDYVQAFLNTARQGSVSQAAPSASASSA